LPFGKHMAKALFAWGVYFEQGNGGVIQRSKRRYAECKCMYLIVSNGAVLDLLRTFSDDMCPSNGEIYLPLIIIPVLNRGRLLTSAALLEFQLAFLLGFLLLATASTGRWLTLKRKTGARECVDLVSEAAAVVGVSWKHCHVLAVTIHY